MNSKTKKASPFYIVDLCKKLIQSKNVTALIYLLLNLGLIFWFFYSVSRDFLWSLLTAVILYLSSSVIALSPIGEWMLCNSQDCKRITDVEILNRLEPLFFEVVERARAKKTDFMLDKYVALYIQDDPDLNAFVIGRRTVCVTTGLLSRSDEEIKAVLGHELGHLAAHDTDLILLITAGNFFISLAVTVVKAVITLMKLIFAFILSLIAGSEGFLVGIVTSIYSFALLVSLNAVMWIWTKIGVLMVMHSSRKAECSADHFSCDLGYMDGMLSFLKSCSNMKMPPSKKVMLALLIVCGKRRKCLPSCPNLTPPQRSVLNASVLLWANMHGDPYE